MNHRYSYCKREAEEREAAHREARDQGGLEPTTLLMSRAYPQGLEPLGYSDPEDQPEDANGTSLRGGRERGRGHEEMELDSKVLEEVPDRQEASFMKTEEEEEPEEESDSRSQSVMDEETQNLIQLMDQRSEEKTDGRSDQED